VSLVRIAVIIPVEPVEGKPGPNQIATQWFAAWEFE